MSESIFERDEFKAYSARWNDRLKQLAYRKGYYDGTIYRNVRDRFEALGQLSFSLGPRLYRGTKALFLPMSRAVDVDAGIIPGGWALAEDAPKAWQAAIDQVFNWSDWERDGVLYVHYGAQYGVSGLKVADLRDAKRVMVKPMDPCTFLPIRTGIYDPTPKMCFVIEQRTGDDGEAYEYAEVITPEYVRTFKNGEEYGVDGRDPEYTNDLGFVPIVQVDHLRTGAEYGEATYQKAIPLLDEVNELASYLSDIVKKHAEAQWMVVGAEPSDMTKSGDNIWFIPQGGDAKALVAPIDVAGVLEFIREIRQQVEGSLPELAFDELKSKTQIATATLELQLMELVLKVKRCRPNYDHGLADALRLAGRASASMGVREVALLDDEALRFDRERPVLPLDRATELALEQQALSLEQQRAIGAPAEGAPARQPMREEEVDDEEGGDDA